VKYTPSATRIADALRGAHENGNVWLDRALVAIADPDPESPLAVALHDPTVWDGFAAEQLRRDLSEGRTPGHRGGRTFGGWLREAETLAEAAGSPAVSDRHFARFIATLGDAVLLGIRPDRLVEATLQREQQEAVDTGDGSAVAAALRDRNLETAKGSEAGHHRYLDKVEELAEETLRRLAGGERLSHVLLAVRRLASMTGREREVAWIDLELGGYQRNRDESAEVLALFGNTRQVPEELAGEPRYIAPSAGELPFTAALGSPGRTKSDTECPARSNAHACIVPMTPAPKTRSFIANPPSRCLD
jgi:hypothetical protein